MYKYGENLGERKGGKWPFRAVFPGKHKGQGKQEYGAW